MKRFSLFIVLLFLMSCQGGSQNRPVEPIDIHVGSQGVEMAFRNVPTVVKGGGRVPIEVELHNWGAVDVNRGHFVLTVDKSALYYNSPPETSINLRGRSKSNPQGEMEIKSFRAKATTLPPTQKQAITPITASLCYPYETRATAIMCIDTEHSGQRLQPKSCQMTPISMSGGQGGPVEITKIVPSIMMSDVSDDHMVPSFDIFLVNFGSGTVSDPQTYAQPCVGGITKTNVVEVDAYLSELPLDCSNNKVILEQDRETMITCTLPDNNGLSRRLGAYTAPLSVNIRYGYSVSMTTTLRITK